jgi:hypothetical protein
MNMLKYAAFWEKRTCLDYKIILGFRTKYLKVRQIIVTLSNIICDNIVKIIILITKFNSLK